MMRETTGALFKAIGLAAVLLSVSGAAARAAETRVIVYDILKEGEPIGTEEYRFERDGNTVKVSVKNSTRAKVLFMNFRYDHTREEVWRDGRLEEVRAQTDDDGTPYDLRMIRQGDGFNLTANGKTTTVPGQALPLTLWTTAVLERPLLLSVHDGENYKVKTETLPAEKVTVGGKEVEAKHYRIAGDVVRELWYGPDGTLLKTRFEKRGYDIVYRLR